MPSASCFACDRVADGRVCGNERCARADRVPSWTAVQNQEKAFAPLCAKTVIGIRDYLSIVPGERHRVRCVFGAFVNMQRTNKRPLVSRRVLFQGHFRVQNNGY